MKNFTIVFLMLVASLSFAQNVPINFETDGNGASWTWTVFENDTNPPLEIIDNPDATGANTSAKVAKFTALEAGQPWAGVESLEGNLGAFYWDENNRIVKIMVWKSVISNVGIKFDAGASPNDWSAGEIKVANTLTNQWEELSFDFSNSPNPPAEFGGLKRIIIFPDFNTEGRGQQNIVYFDNISFQPSEDTPTEPTVAAPAPPSRNADDVISLFSEAYTDVPVDTWITDWSEAAYEEVTIAGRPTKKYTNLDFVGIETINNQLNINEMTHFHLNVWSANYTFFAVKLVDFGPDGAYGGGDDKEHPIEFVTPEQGGWISLDIPLSEFTGLTTRENIAQLILVGQPTGQTTVYVDNVYFYKAGEVSDAPNAPIDFETDGFGADWTWTVFENDSNPPLEIIDNPDATGVNTSAKVAKFTALEAGNPWAGVESLEGDLGEFYWDENNSVVKIMVWKSVISDVGIKFDAGASPNDWSDGEIKVANTLTNEWEELSFDFSNSPNPPAEFGGLKRIIIFPDFNTEGRGQENIVYFDNITFNPSEPIVDGPDQPAPSPPERNAADVISLFSEVYTDVPVDTWRTNWSAVSYEEVTIAGRPTKKYTNLDFVGIETINNQLNISEMTHFHVNVWSDDFTLFGVKLVDFGPDGAYGGGDDKEHQVDFDAPEQSTWISLDIPLSDFTGLTTRENFSQLIFVGRPIAGNTVYVDNVYFYKDPQTNIGTPATAYTQVRIFPNPVSAGTLVQLSAEAEKIDVYDLMGRLIITSANTSVISTENIHKGIYIVQIHTKDDGIQTQKLIVN